MDLKSNNENECMSENCEPADNLELERDDSGGTEDSMEGELVGNTLTILTKVDICLQFVYY